MSNKVLGTLFLVIGGLSIHHYIQTGCVYVADLGTFCDEAGSIGIIVFSLFSLFGGGYLLWRGCKSEK